MDPEWAVLRSGDAYPRGDRGHMDGDQVGRLERRERMTRCTRRWRQHVVGRQAAGALWRRPCGVAGDEGDRSGDRHRRGGQRVAVPVDGRLELADGPTGVPEQVTDPPHGLFLVARVALVPIHASHGARPPTRPKSRPRSRLRKSEAAAAPGGSPGREARRAVAQGPPSRGRRPRAGGRLGDRFAVRVVTAADLDALTPAAVGSSTSTAR